MQNRIRELRKARGLTMKQLGVIVDLAESTISQYETGRRQPDNETLLRLGEYFGVTVDYLLGGGTVSLPADLDYFAAAMLRFSSVLSERDKAVLLHLAQQLSKADCTSAAE